MAKKKRRIKKKVQPQKTVEAKDLIHRTKIRVIGIGGGGSSIVSEIAPQVQKVDFVVANTDVQALKQAGRAVRIFRFGEALTRGLGCGMDVKIGQRAAKEAKTQIARLLQGVDLCILVASLGAGTGSGASPEFAKIARDLKIMTLGIFTLPFKFEGGRKTQIAKSSLKKLIPNLNAIAIIPNENIFQIIDKKTPLKQAFSTINKRLAENLRGLCEMVFLPGLVNIDFADLKTILEGRGKLAYLNSAIAQGQNRTEEVLKQVLKSPLNEYNIQGAEKIIFNITAAQDLGMSEVAQISQAIADFNRRAKIIFGISQNNNYHDKIRIALLALGCGKEPKPKPKPKSKPRRKIKPKARKTRRKLKHSGGPAKMRSFRRGIKKRSKKPTSVSVPVEEVKEEPVKSLSRRTALDLKKAVEETEKEMLAQEKKWDIPAFLRKKSDESQ